MSRLMLFLMVVIILSGCAFQSVRSSPREVSKTKPQGLEGAYEFISETIILTKPQKLTERRSYPEWKGLWLFQDGRFSQSLMKQRRNWYPFPHSQEDLGYFSSAGTYKVTGKSLLLKHELSLNPLGTGDLTTLEYRLEGDTLTLTEIMLPYMEDLSEGRSIIVLRQIK